MKINLLILFFILISYTVSAQSKVKKLYEEYCNELTTDTIIQHGIIINSNDTVWETIKELEYLENYSIWNYGIYDDSINFLISSPFIIEREYIYKLKREYPTNRGFYFWIQSQKCD